MNTSGRHRAPNIVDVQYEQTGASVNTDALGMREMQQRAFAERNAQHLLIKAPPASGKSRALMFIGLDKLYNQGRKKVIVAVPERSIGASFATTDLKSHGFFADWTVEENNNLCNAGTAQSKVKQFVDFLQRPDPILVCTHATLRFAFEQLSPADFNGCVLAIDEFHHVSADTESNRLGELLRDVMNGSDVHIVAMTGSYFRGDSVPVLLPDVEEKFTPVTFNYYDQLNGYRYLKSLGIGHHFYQGRYVDAIGEVLDLDKKTIIHIPSVNSGESTKDKLEEVDYILDAIGDVAGRDEDSGLLLVKRKDTGSILRIADLVDDTDYRQRAQVLGYLTDVAAKNRDACDVIIALGMAKEGFDWPYAEHALTVGYRASLTEVIQIIGRVTRDSEGKTHAQFTNLIAEPEASQDDVTLSVNNMLKAITASLLMEQVLAPNFAFKAKKRTEGGEDNPNQVVRIKNFAEPSTERSRQIIESDLNDLKATILQNPIFNRVALGETRPEEINKILIPKIIRDKYPNLSEPEVEEVRQHVVADAVIKKSEISTVGNDRFVKMASTFVNIEDLDINLIDSVNPFQKAFEVLSKSVTPSVLRLICDEIESTHIEVTQEEVEREFPRIKQWMSVNRRQPDPNSDNYREARDAQIVRYLQRKIRARQAAQSEDTSGN